MRRLQTLHHGSRCFSTDRRAFLFENIGSVLKEGAKVCQRQLINEMLGPLITSSLAIWAARRRHLFSAASNPAFSAAS